MRRWKVVAPSVPKDSVSGIESVIKDYDEEIESIARKAQENINKIIHSSSSSQQSAAKPFQYNNLESKQSNNYLMSPQLPPAFNNMLKMEDGVVDEDNYGTDGGTEEILLSNQIYSSGNRSIARLQSNFEILQVQTKEYQNSVQKLKDMISAGELRSSSLEQQIDEIDGELERLKKEKANTVVGSRATAMGGQRRPLTSAGTAVLKGEQIRKALLLEDDGVTAISMDQLFEQGFLKWIGNWFIRFLPLKRELRLVEEQFGSSVLSYFVFQRFILMQFSFLAIAAIIFSYFHISLMKPKVGWMGLLVSPGLLPNFMTFSSFQPSEKLLFSSMIVAGMAGFLISTIDKFLREDRLAKELEALETDVDSPFSNLALGAWDFSITSSSEVAAAQVGIAQNFLLMLDDTKREQLKRSRSNLALLRLYSWRALVMLFYIATQLSAFALMIYLSLYSEQATRSIQHLSKLTTFVTYVPMLTFNAIGQVMPLVAKLATTLEAWDSGHMELNLLLVRVYTHNTISSLLLAISSFLLADPFLFAQSTRVRVLQPAIQSKFPCRVDQAADNLFSLLIVTFASNLVSFLASPALAYLKSSVFASPFIRPKFEVAQEMVTTLLFIGVIFIAFPLSPLTVVFSPFLIYFDIKWKIFCSTHLYSKPERSWKAQRAMPVFTVLYLLSLVALGVVPSAYFLSSKTFPKDCSLQDASIHLCLDAVSNEDTCSTDPSSEFFKAYGGGGIAYPADICQLACGPFVLSSSAAEPFKQAIANISVLHWMWIVLIDYPYVPYFVLFTLAIVVVKKMNSLEVVRSTAAHRERMLDAHILGLEAEKQQQQRKISRLTAIDDDSAVPFSKSANLNRKVI